MLISSSQSGAELADQSGLTSGHSVSIPWNGERAPTHDRGWLLAQLAVMLAGGGECVSDMAALRDQPDLFGAVPSAPTIWRAVDDIDETVLAALRSARATARARLWDRSGPPVAGEVVLDVDAALIDPQHNYIRTRSHDHGSVVALEGGADRALAGPSHRRQHSHGNPPTRLISHRPATAGGPAAGL